MINTSLSQEFGPRNGDAKLAATEEPVIDTNCGRQTPLQMSVERLERFAKQRRNISDVLAMPGGADVQFEPSHVTIETRLPDLS